MKRWIAPRAVGRVARAVGLGVGVAWIVAALIGFINIGAEPVDLISRPAPLVVVIPGVLLAARALMLRVRVDAGTFVIVSWWRTYRFDSREVDELLVEHYSGYINRWADTDIMARNVKMIGVAIAGRDRFFPATAMTNATARRVLPELARVLDAPLEVMPQ